MASPISDEEQPRALKPSAAQLRRQFQILAIPLELSQRLWVAMYRFALTQRFLAGRRARIVAPNVELTFKLKRAFGMFGANFAQLQLQVIVGGQWLGRWP